MSTSWRRHLVVRVGAWSSALLIAACGSDGESAEQVRDIVSPAPIPAEMCDEDEAPVVAAYARRDGGLEWVVCSPARGRNGVLAATDEAVHLESLVAYDAADGTELPSADPPPTGSSGPERTADGRATIEVGDVRIEGGQDDPTSGVDAETGAVLWTRAGSPAYDDVWAVGDGAVFVIDRVSDPTAPRLVAYEVASGEERWALDGVDPYGTELGWPWHVDDDVLITIWSNLALLSTDDGTTIWRTDYPVVEFPRMTGARANDDTVFVAFSSVPSGGD